MNELKGCSTNDSPHLEWCRCDALRAELTKEREQHAGTLKEFDEFRTSVGQEFKQWKSDREKVLSQSQQIGELVEALKTTHPEFCGMKCPSVKYDDKPWPHVPLCESISKVLRSVEQGEK